MLNNLISLHSYWIVNIAIGLGYVISRVVLSIRLTGSLLQIQRLKLAKAVFGLTLISFLIVPIIAEKLAYNPPGNFQIQPLLMHVSNTLIDKHHQVITHITELQTVSYGNIFTILVTLFITIGILYFFINYLKNILRLKKIASVAYCQHKIGSVKLLFTDETNIPFCWSTLKKHFVVIPNALLEKNSDLKLAVQHEFQHIRQGDTYWSHFLAVINIVCFWNPFVKLWSNLFSELQEFACDEALVLRKKASPLSYGQCLVDTAARTTSLESLPQGALGIISFSKNSHITLLQRRVSMLFHYKKIKSKLSLIIAAYSACFILCITSAYAFSSNTGYKFHSSQELNNIISQSLTNNSLQVRVTPEVLAEINDITSSDKARTYMTESLTRMKNYQSLIEQQLTAKNMPNDLLVLPLVESGYRALDQSKNPLRAAGIWQVIPSTADKFGLSINKTQDQRLNTEMETKAALAYLSALHDRYNDWRLAAIAYEIGEISTDNLIKQVGSRDGWTLARSASAPAELAKYLALLDAAVIIMHNPSLLAN